MWAPGPRHHGTNRPVSELILERPERVGVLGSQEIQTLQLDEAPDWDILDSKEVALRRDLQE